MATYLLEWQNENKTMSRTDQDAEQLGPSFTAGGNANSYSHSGKQFCQFLMQLHTEFPYHAAVPLLGIYSRERKNPYVNIYSGCIHNCPKLEATKTSFNWWMKKISLCIPTVSCSLRVKESELLLAAKWPTDFANSQKPKPKGCILCDSTYLMLWKRQNFGDRGKIGGCQRLGVGGRAEHKGSGWGNIWGLENCSVSWLWWWIHDYAFLKKKRQHCAILER